MSLPSMWNTKAILCFAKKSARYWQNIGLTVDRRCDTIVIGEDWIKLSFTFRDWRIYMDKTNTLKPIKHFSSLYMKEQAFLVSIITDHDVIPLEHLPLCAALAHKAGLPYMES